MKSISVAEQPEHEVEVVDEPILSGWLTYKGDQRAGFVAKDGTEAIKGAPRPGDGIMIGWDGRLWVAHEAELSSDEFGDDLRTHVRFRLVYRDGKVIAWKDTDQ